MKKILLAIFAIFFAATVFAIVPTLANHYIDSVQISNGQEVTTAHPTFEYKVTLFNDHSLGKLYEMREVISNKLTLLNANMPYYTVAVGEYNVYVFDDISVTGNGSTDVIMNFKNETTDEQKAVSINTSFCELATANCFGDFQFFVFKATVPAIPEFGFFLIPVGIVLGSYYFISKKKVLA